MATLDNKTLKDFAQAILGASGPTSTIKYGTVSMGTDGPHVTLDGSTSVTPVVTNMDVRNGDRVMVDIIDHTAIITGNVTSPPSGRSASDQPSRVYFMYAVNTEDTPPIEGWQERIPEFGPGDNVWQRTINEFPDGTSTIDVPRIIYGNSISGEDAVTMTINSTNGSTIRYKTDETVLEAVIIKGATRINDLQSAISAFGNTFSIGWQYKNSSDARWTSILPTDPRISGNGFYLAVGYNDVSGSTTFRCVATRLVHGTTAETIADGQITIDNVTNAYTHGLSTYSHTFVANSPLGARVGDTCMVSAYLFEGTAAQKITVKSVTDPAGMTHTTSYNGTDHPTITYTVTSAFISGRTSTITYTYNDIDFVQTISFAVAAKGSDGKDGEDGTDGTDGKDGADGISYGAQPSMYIFTGNSNGAIIGDTCEFELYFREGKYDRAISVSAGYIDCPTGIAVDDIIDNQTTHPVIRFKVTQQFTTTKQALIMALVNYTAYYYVVVFGVAKDGKDGRDGEDGTDGQDGKDGASSFGLTISASNGTVFTERDTSTVLTASAYYGSTQLSIRNGGFVYNESLLVGMLEWSIDGGQHWGMTDSKTINAAQCLPALIVKARIITTKFTAEVFVESEVCLVFCSNIKVAKRYYYKRATSQGAPSKPTTFPPSSVWVDTEPSVSDDEISTTTLWYVEVVQYSDGSFVYSEVAEYTAFVSSKHALSQAMAAIVAADTALDDSEQAKQDAYDALVAATAYLKLDPVLEKIVISKLGETGWTTAAIDSNGFYVGEYNPVYHTYTPYTSVHKYGVNVFSGATPTGSSHVGGYSITDENDDAGDYYGPGFANKSWALKADRHSNVKILYDYSNADHRQHRINHTYTILATSTKETNPKSGSSIFSISGGQMNDLVKAEEEYEDERYYPAVMLATSPYTENDIRSIPNDTAADGDSFVQRYSSMFMFFGDSYKNDSESTTCFTDDGGPVFIIGGTKYNTLNKATPNFAFYYNDHATGAIQSPISQYDSTSNMQPMFITKGSLPVVLQCSLEDNSAPIMFGYWTGTYTAGLGYLIQTVIELPASIINANGLTPTITLLSGHYISVWHDAQYASYRKEQLSIQAITANARDSTHSINVQLYVESIGHIEQNQPLFIRLKSTDLRIEFL